MMEKPERKTQLTIFKELVDEFTSITSYPYEKIPCFILASMKVESVYLEEINNAICDLWEQCKQ
jgi:hypothetical protein